MFFYSVNCEIIFFRGFFFGCLTNCIDILVLCTRQDILGQYSMVNLELFNIVDEIKKVSKAFVVHPKNVNAGNSTSMQLSV